MSLIFILIIIFILSLLLAFSSYSRNDYDAKKNDKINKALKKDRVIFTSSKSRS